jgi:hypothetical protein
VSLALFLLSTKIGGEILASKILGYNSFSSCILTETTRLKFTSTSYNNDGNKFNLVVSVSIQEENELYPRILDAKISPPIFVDSRKSARDTNVAKDIKTCSFYELF